MALSQVCNVNAGSRHIVMMSQILKMESYIPERRIPQTEIPISLFFSTPSMSAMRVGIQLATKETKKKKRCTIPFSTLFKVVSISVRVRPSLKSL